MAAEAVLELRHPAPEAVGPVSLIKPRVRRIALKCDAKDPEVVCRDRAAATRRGQFMWDTELLAYVDRYLSLRSMSKRTRYFVYSERKDSAHPDHTGEPYQVVDCVYCGMPLPALVELPRAESLSQGDGAEN